MIKPELKVSSKPPLATTSVLVQKRYSLNAVEPLKNIKNLARRSSQDLPHKEESSSWWNLRQLDSKSRSASLAQLTISGRTLSASNLAALSDSNLSVQVALPQRSYEYTGSESNLAKQSFEVVVKRYFEQVTVGCGNSGCWNKFCASNTSSRKLNLQLASFVSIELATLGKEYFCKEVPRAALGILSLTDDQHSSSLTREQKRILPTNEYKLASSTGKPVSFLHMFFSCSPFKFLFSNERVSEPSKKLKSGSLRDLKRTIASSGSDLSSLKLSDSWLGGRNQRTAFRQHGNKSNLDFAKQAVIYDKVKSPTLLDFQRDIESIDIDEASLEEFEDKCVLEMSCSNLKELSLTHLTLPMLETSVENYRHNRDRSFLINTIRTVFSNPEALNASFLQVSASSKLQCSKHDINAVRSAYKLLVNLQPKEVFCQALQNSAEILVKTIQKLKPAEVFQIVVLLENPLVQGSGEIMQMICNVLANQEQETRTSLVETLADYDSENFQKILTVVQSLLSSQLHVNQCSEAHIISICIMLETLHQANVMSGQKTGPLVLASEFYNTELSQKLDYKMEYKKWRMISENSQRTSNDLSSMTILDFPFILAPASKVRIMRIHTMLQMGFHYRDAIVYQTQVQQAKKAYEDDEIEIEDSLKSAMNPFLVLEVRRDHLIEDTLIQLKQKENDLKKALKIRYIGGGEQGLDLGGLQKEFFHIIINDIIQPDYGMFTYLEEVQLMWINSSSLESDLLFELVGMLLGIAIYNGIILDLHFPPVIYKKLQGGQAQLSDVTEVDPALARSLRSLLEYDGDVEDTFCYTFQISHTVFDEVFVVSLKENGEDIAVTKENRDEFVQLYVEYLLNTSIARQFEALSCGFHKVCDMTCLGLFHWEELALLICGSPQIDFTSIKEASTYKYGYTETHPTIVAFWEIVHDLCDADKKLLLSFVTGSDRVPLPGLSNVAFEILKHGDDPEKLPTALTCFNQLMLPDYPSKEKLKDRLFLAIQNSKGFGLT